MKSVLCLLFGVFLFLFQNNYAAYITVKKVNGKVVTLDKSDKKNRKAIWAVFKKYQWPMCLASKNLTKDEVRELFFSEKNVEEAFLRKKLQEIDKTYEVIFVPTVLAQLFLLLNVYDNEMDISQLGISIFDKNYSDKISIYGRLDIELLVELEDPESKKNDIYKPYARVIRRMNKGYFAFSKSFFEWLSLTDLENETSIQSSSDMENSAEQILCRLVKDVIESYESTIKELDADHNFLNHSSIEVNELMYQAGVQVLKNDSLLKKTLNLEYQARCENNFLLFRGDSFINQCLNVDGKGLLVDTTFPSSYKIFGKHTKKIFNRGRGCRSISYSNNILDGVVNDLGACTYSYFLEGSDCVYALALSKAQYWVNGYENLFFVSPLDYLNATFAEGELFHSRSKGSVEKEQQSSDEFLEMSGVADCITDRVGMLTVERDPFLHEAMFSRVFEKHAIFLHGKNKGRLVKENRKNVTKFYRAIFLIKNNEKLIQDKAKELLGKEKIDNQNIPVVNQRDK